MMSIDTRRSGQSYPHRFGFALLHGGGLGPWVWGRLIKHLSLAAVALGRVPPGASHRWLTRDRCAAWGWEQVDAAGIEQVVLVAHSIAGVLVPALIRRAPRRVASVVLVGANAPQDGQTALAAFPAAERWQVAMSAGLSLLGVTPQKALEQYIRERLCNDLDAETTRKVVAGGMHPEPPALFVERVSWLGLPSIPYTYIQLEHDRALAPATQAYLARVRGAQLVPLASGHTAMLSRPAELATILHTVVDHMMTPQTASQ